MSPQRCPVQWAGTSALVKLPPEVDISNAGAIGDGLQAVLWMDALSVFVDMSTTTFCDCAGVSALIGAYLLAQERQAEFRLVLDAPAVHRILELTGADRFLDVHPTMSSALAYELGAGPAAHPPRGAAWRPGGPPVDEPLAQYLPAQDAPAEDSLAQDPPAQVPPAAPSLSRQRCGRTRLARRPTAAPGCIWRWGRAPCSLRGRGQAPGYRWG